MTTKYICLLFFIVLLTGITISDPAKAVEEPGPLKIFVSILPMEYFADQIGQDRIVVETLVQPGHSPATYAPTPKQITRLAHSHAYFRVGVPFENTLVPKLKRTVPDLDIIDLRDGIDMIPLQDTHAEHGEHRGEMDPHSWLDPSLALHQAMLIRDALIRLDPEGETLYRTNFADLKSRLEELDNTLRENLRPLRGQSMYVFHPAYGYFCRAYNLKQRAINPGGREPGAKHLARLIEEARKENVRVIFVQTQFSTKAANTIARSIGGKVVALDPLARDYPTNMMYISRQLTDSFSKTKNLEHTENK